MALPTQTAISEETFHEPDLLRAAAGRRSRQLGDMFEQWLLRGCDWYWDKENAYIEKTPEPMRPIKVYGDRRKGQFIAIYTKQVQPDFKGTLCDGSTIIFDAKSTSQDILQQSVVTDEQRKEFDRYEKMEARCYIMATLDFTDFYRTPWSDWKAGPEKLGRKHFKRTDLEPYRIPRGPYAMHFWRKSYLTGRLRPSWSVPSRKITNCRITLCPRFIPSARSMDI